MFRRTLVLISAFLACSVSAQLNIVNNNDLNAQARKPETYLPKNARSCEQAVTTGDTKYCRSCNKEATIGAAQRVTIQVGGCTARRLQEVEGTAGNSQGEARELRADKLRVAEFTTERVTFFEPVAAPGLTSTGPNILNGATNINGQLATAGPNTLNGATNMGQLATAGPNTLGGTTNINGQLATVGPTTLGGITTIANLVAKAR